MKLCTRMTVTDGKPGEILDVSVVDDDHPSGLTADETELHVAGKITAMTIESGRVYEGDDD